MSIVTWILAGGLVGYAASRYTTNTGNEAIAFNAVVGMVGAALAGAIVGPLLGVPPGFGTFALLVSVCGAAALLFCVHFVQQTLAR